MAMLDVREPRNVEEPCVKGDSLVEGRAVDLVAPRRSRPRKEQGAEVILHAVPVHFEVVVALNEREGVSIGDEAAQRVEDVAMALGDQPQLDANMVDGVAKTVLALFVAALGRQLHPIRPHGHSNEVDEVACDHKAPTATRKGEVKGVVANVKHAVKDAARH
jgi:hypothetical protein